MILRRSVMPLFIIVLWFVAASPSLLAQKQFYKGNTHTHMYPWSGDIRDSTYTADTVVADYKARGYDFLIMTNHGAWADFSGMSTPSFTVINGEEVGISRNGRWGHFTAAGLDHKLSGAGLTHQQLIDSIFASGATPFLNHPRFDMIPLNADKVIDSMKTHLMHMEVWNAVTAHQPPPDDISVWDSVLSTGRLIYGVACDDSHRKQHQGKAWIMVYASSNHADALLQAIRDGEFYASNGIVLDSVDRTPTKIFVRTTNGTEIRFIGKNGVVLATVLGSEGSYSIKGNEVYVRAEVLNDAGQRAWVQPVMVVR